MIATKKTIAKIVLLLAIALLAACNDNNDYDATGTFEAVEITLSSEANGKILSLDIDEGDTVCVGDILGGIDSLQLVLQRQQLQLQQQAILAGKPDIQRQVASLRDQIKKQEKELERLQKMYQQGAATAKQVDDVETQLSVLRSQHDATLQTLNSSSVAANSNAAAIEVQMRSVDNLVNKCAIVAPANGTVLVKYVEVGEMAVQGKPLIKIADLGEMYLRAYFTSSQLDDVKLGQHVKVVADFGGDSQIVYPGVITWISSESEFTPKGVQTRDSRANLVYAVKVAVKNDGRLKIGFYGEVIL